VSLWEVGGKGEGGKKARREESKEGGREETHDGLSVMWIVSCGALICC